MYNVIEAKKSKKWITHIVAKQDGGTERKEDSAIRGGLSWPMGVIPGYHCILGEEYVYTNRDDKKVQRGKLHLLGEYEYLDTSIDMMFAKLADDVVQLHCGTVYTHTNEEYQDYLEAYRDFCYAKKVSLGRLDQAPFAENFQLGISLIKDWWRTGRLVLPEQSIVREQLKRIFKQELNDKPEDKFYAINGLRFAVAAFHKFKPVRHRTAYKQRLNAMSV